MFLRYTFLPSRVIIKNYINNCGWSFRFTLESGHNNNNKSPLSQYYCEIKMNGRQKERKSLLKAHSEITNGHVVLPEKNSSFCLVSSVFQLFAPREWNGTPRQVQHGVNPGIPFPFSVCFFFSPHLSSKLTNVPHKH
jgi:hypothetical protein